MNIAELQKKLAEYVEQSAGNYIQEEFALSPECVGMRMFDAPLVGVAAADDPLFQSFHDDEHIIGETFRPPTLWLPQAKSVVSCFFPISEAVRTSNVDNIDTPSAPWMHVRIEGGAFMAATNRVMADWLRAEGAQVAIPADDTRFPVQRRSAEEAADLPLFRPAWSERHVAYAAGLGTFGLCSHLITAKGKSGRFCSFVTDVEFEVTPRPYGEDYMAYCTRCGACVERCPVGALTLGQKKDVQACNEFLEDVKVRYAPYFGCGKCQLNVPCETGIPAR